MCEGQCQKDTSDRATRHQFEPVLGKKYSLRLQQNFFQTNYLCFINKTEIHGSYNAD